MGEDAKIEHADTSARKLRRKRRWKIRPIEKLSPEQKELAPQYLVFAQRIVHRSLRLVKNNGTLRTIDFDVAHDMAVDELLRVVTRPENQPYAERRIKLAAGNVRHTIVAKRKREPVRLETDSHSRATTTRDPISRLQVEDDFERLVSPLEDEQAKEVLRRLYVHDQDYHEIAEFFGITQSGVRKIRGRALRKLRGH